MVLVLFSFRLAVESCIFRSKVQGMRNISGHPVVDFEPEGDYLTDGFKEQRAVF